MNELYGKPHPRNNEAHKLSFAIYIYILNQPNTLIHPALTKSDSPAMESISQNLIKFCIHPTCDIRSYINRKTKVQSMFLLPSETLNI